ncbi:hypothetical protein [Undibacterium sp. TS12]|uniref:hypothetical protein n=1 Tax=Undibacterium sp. TS12 TaxID=2908202 RepID=UPI001F4CE90F|nr:hypothetical protein [Undibacterium sp. TS12]MCH8622557.1 hypothetical protein [Undibacterium sp. TS12]
MIDEKSEEFIQNSKEYWVGIDNGSSKTASAKERANKEIVAEWVRGGVVSECLLPLLMHSSIEVRFAAAAHLINHAEKEKAIAVLRKLIKESEGLISPSAVAVLRIHKIPVTP